MESYGFRARDAEEGGGVNDSGGWGITSRW